MKNTTFRTQKFQLCTIFRGRTDRQLRCLLSISLAKTALQIDLRIVTMCSEVICRTVFMVLYLQYEKHFFSYSKGSTMHHFLRSHNSPFTWHFVYFLRPKRPSEQIYAWPRGATRYLTGRRLWFPYLQYDKQLFSYSKGSIMHHSSRSHGSSFKWHFIYFLGQITLQIVLRFATMRS